MFKGRLCHLWQNLPSISDTTDSLSLRFWDLTEFCLWSFFKAARLAATFHSKVTSYVDVALSGSQPLKISGQQLLSDHFQYDRKHFTSQPDCLRREESKYSTNTEMAQHDLYKNINLLWAFKVRSSPTKMDTWRMVQHRLALMMLRKAPVIVQ